MLVTYFRVRASIVVLLVLTAHAWAQEPVPVVGRVKTATGEATIVRAGKALAASVGTLLFESDVLRTGADGLLGVTLRDETRLSLGPASELSLTEFSFAPAAGRLTMLLRVLRGTVAYISGRIAKLAPDRVRIETPAMVIGVRGTQVLIKVDAP